MEIVPFFLIWGLLVGRGRLGLALAVIVPVGVWTYLWISTDAELYDDGPLEPGFFIFVMAASVTFALIGVAIRLGIRRLRRTLVRAQEQRTSASRTGLRASVTSRRESGRRSWWP